MYIWKEIEVVYIEEIRLNIVIYSLRNKIKFSYI